MELRAKRFHDGFQPGAVLDGLRSRPCSLREWLPWAGAGNTPTDAVAAVLHLRRRDSALPDPEVYERRAHRDRARNKAAGAAARTALAHSLAEEGGAVN